MNVANILSQTRECDVIVTGGSLRQSDGGLIGDIATAAIRRFKFDIGVIDGDILGFAVQEVGVSQAILPILDQPRIAVALTAARGGRVTSPGKTPA